MPQHFTETVVQPPIPYADMTSLERLLLAAIFETEATDEGLYLFSREGPVDFPYVPPEDLRIAHAASTAVPSRLNDRVSALLDLDDVENHVENYLSGEDWTTILQDIVRRSSTLEYITVVAAFTCTKMMPDAIGGLAMLITGDAVRVKNTDDLIGEFLVEHRAGRGKRPHVLLAFDESEVRPIIRDAIETDDSLTTLAADAVSDNDIHAASTALAASIDLSDERGSALFKAAIAAIRYAKQRRRPD